MSVRVVLTGFEELRLALRQLPDHLVDEATGIVTARAEAAAAQVVAAYPEKSGNLRKGVKVDQLATGRGGVARRVRSTSKHAYLYENGTQARHTDLGANRGAMPPAHVFVPTMIRERREMTRQLAAMVEREGLTVTGDLVG